MAPSTPATLTALPTSTGPVDVGKAVSVAGVDGATLLVYSSDLS